MSKIEELVSTLSSLTVLEMSELKEALKKEWGVEATAAMAVAAAPAAVEEKKEEFTDFDVILESFDAAKKISVIKEIRAATSMGLQDAKAAVEGAPSTVKEALSKEDAEQLKAKLEAAGGKVTLKGV